MSDKPELTLNARDDAEMKLAWKNYINEGGDSESAITFAESDAGIPLFNRWKTCGGAVDYNTFVNHIKTLCHSDEHAASCANVENDKAFKEAYRIYIDQFGTDADPNEFCITGKAQKLFKVWVKNGGEDKPEAFVNHIKELIAAEDSLGAQAAGEDDKKVNRLSPDELAKKIREISADIADDDHQISLIKARKAARFAEAKDLGIDTAALKSALSYMKIKNREKAREREQNRRQMIFILDDDEDA